MGDVDRDPQRAESDWVPAFEGQRPPFLPGNAKSLLHGARSPRIREPLAEQIVQDVLADESVPAYAKAPAFRMELQAMARAEAQVYLVGGWLAAQAGEDGVPDLGSDRVRTAYGVLHRAEQRAASARQRLGLSPAAAARLGKDVAVGEAAASVDVAQRMALLAAHEEELKRQGWQPPAIETAATEATDDGSTRR